MNVMPRHSCDTTKTMLLNCLDDHGMLSNYTHTKKKLNSMKLLNYYHVKKLVNSIYVIVVNYDNKHGTLYSIGVLFL